MASVNIEFSFSGDPAKAVKRIAVVDRDLCIREKCGYLCIKYCPVNRAGKPCIETDDEGYPVISELLCIGCGICVRKCPVDAITIVNLSKDLGPLVHSYGENAFRLYGLALPKEGKAVAFLGKNGIGKTTNLKIISGVLKPNLGGKRLDELPIEIREYLKGLKHKTVSIKPQEIEELRKLPLTVESLFEKLTIEVPESLSHIKTRKLEHLSGGELQKVALEVALSKKADIYYVDEPMTYLDIRNRLETALRLRGEVERGKTLVVVEHDLTVVDYICEFAYIFHGMPSAYGGVSGIKHIRNAVNEFLDGYLKAENLRIRDYKISFGKHVLASEELGEVVFSYPSFSINLDGFRLEVEEGDIREGEVIGIVGENGIGKSTFVKALAGIIKAEGYEPPEGLKLSYKPQEFRRSSAVVKELFKDVDKGVLNVVKRKLMMREAIFEKTLDKISGGELQRVAIALTLSREADVYLLDEPTAFLDVEQRLLLADLLHEIASEKKKPIFVVDHDIMFIEHLSNRVMVFTGVPGKHGRALSPMDKIKGMNEFLKNVGVTVRKDKDSKRPRINKPGSALDKEMRKKGIYFQP